MAESVWTRAYLKSLGHKDDEIGYDNGAVTLKNKPFFRTGINADSKAYGTQRDLDSAYKAYQGNDSLEQYKTNLNKPITPFTYDMNSIKADPLYTSALGSYSQDVNRGTDTALVNLGRRGIGNSSSAVQAEVSGQKSINDFANTKLAPQVIAQKYQQYLDTNAQQDKQNQGLLGLAGLYDQQNQQSFNNNLATNQDRRADQSLNFNQGVTEAGLTGYYQQYADQIAKMNNNSQSWFDASPEEQQRLAAENQDIGRRIGATQDANGDWVMPQGQKTMAARGQEFNQNLATDQFQYGKEQDAANMAFKQQEANRQAQQFAASQGLQWANLDQRQREFYTEQATRKQQLENDSQFKAQNTAFEQGMQLFKETGQMPDYMNQFGISPEAFNNEATKADVAALYEGLSSGQLKPDQALKMIEDKVRLKLESPQDGELMKQAIFTLYPEMQGGSSGGSSGDFMEGTFGTSPIKGISDSFNKSVKESLPKFRDWWIKQTLGTIGMFGPKE